MNILLSLGLAMVFGLLLNRVVKKIGLPNVTGYLVAGLLIGPYVLNIFPSSAAQSVGVITDVALGFIAFSIGGEFKLSSIKQIGRPVITITFFQALAAAALVDIGLLAAGFDPPLAIVLGAIATATAPAATLMVVRQYKARGPVTNILLPVVALDDAIGLVVFSISMAVAQVLGAGKALSVGAMLASPAIEIFGSLAIGAALGVAIALCGRFFHSSGNRLSVELCAVFLGVAMAQMWELSSLCCLWQRGPL